MNGYVAVEGQFPYQVAVLAATDGDRYYVCSGSIISPEWVLSAAHCTYPHEEFILRFGSTNLWSGGELQCAKEVINHPDYNPVNLNNDISLLKVQTPLDLINGALRAIRLPKSQHQGIRFVGNRSRVAGWGIDNSGEISEQLNFVDLEIIDNGACRRIYGSDRVVEHVLCGYGYINRNQATCGGDSGSALVVFDEGEWIQVGVASFGALQCQRRFPSGFMRVTEFVDWINGQIGDPNVSEYDK